MTAPNPEMTIPKARGDVIIRFVLASVVVGFALLALVNLWNRIALIGSSLWLAFVVMMIWSGAKEEQGVGRFLANCLGEMIGRHFVESTARSLQAGEIRFGFEILGHRFIQKQMQIGDIESVEWNTGQATDIAGRDMNDWHVCLWFDHHDPLESARKSKWGSRHLDQSVYCVGPSTRKDRAEALGLRLVAFLRTAGAQLAQGATSTCFVRQRSETGAIASVPSDTTPNGG